MRSNAMRFISSYNNIDKVLRNVYNFKASLSFTDVVRRCAQNSSIVRKYEDELLSFSRLRNAIIHNSVQEKIIAEPHDDIVEQIEMIEKLVTSPPSILSALHKALICTHDVSLSKAIKMMTDGGYSNMPVLKNGLILGVASNKLIVEAIAKALKNSVDIRRYLDSTPISDVLSSDYGHYVVVPPTLTIDAALNMFHASSKLRIILITKGGTLDGEIEGVVTIEDLTRMSDLVFSY